MTPEQQKDAERLERYIAREGLSSVMNDSKWREAIEVIGQVKGYVRFRVKCVRDPEPRPDRWESSFPYHVPRPYKVIEWLEIDPIEEKFRGQLLSPETRDRTEALIDALRSHSIPFIHENARIRIQGYTRP